MKWISDLLTNKSGDHDIGRWSWALSTLSIIGGGAWNAIHAGTVDLMAFAGALSAIAGAHGIAIGAKGHTE